MQSHKRNSYILVGMILTLIVTGSALIWDATKEEVNQIYFEISEEDMGMQLELSQTPSTMVIYIEKLKGETARSVFENAMLQRWGEAIYPMTFKWGPDANDCSCILEVKSGDDFPESDVPCDCRDDAYLLKIVENE